MNTMEVNAQQPQKKKSKLKDVPVTVYRIIEVPPNIEGVRKTATIQIVPESEFDDETSDPSGSDDPDKVNVTVTSFVIDDDNMVKQHSTSKIIRLPVPIQCRRQHSIFNEAIEADVNDGNSDLLGRNYSCAICMKTFKHGSHLKRHVNTHTGERIYKCDLCDKTFLDASTLSRHRKIHSGDKPWSCKICKKSFGTLGSLRRHITVHNQEGRPYQCETCKKRFPDNSSYQKHKFIHTGIKPYGCDICGKAFVHIGDLNGHRKIHVEVKPYNCERCGKDFAKHSNYARHLLIHEGDKEFLCTICGVSYNFQSSLTRHLLTHVRKNTNASAEVSSVNDKNIDLVSQGKHSSLDNDDLATETTERKVVSNVNKIKVTRTKMKHFRKIKQLHRFQDHTRIEKPDKLPSLSVSNLPQPPEAPESEPTVPVTEDIIVPDLIDPTVLPPQDEFISKQTTTEDVTALLSSVDDFGSTKDIAQALLQLTPHPVYGTSSGSVISLFSDSSGSEYVLSTTKSGETGSDVQTSGNNGAVISDSDSVITIISVSDDPVMSVGSIAANTSVSDSSELVVTVLEPIEADDTIAETSVSDIHNNIANNMKGASNRESSKQALTEVSDVEGKETLVLKKRGDISVSNGEERKTVGPKEGF
jgi:uncharacterized Zn-finger protein